MKNAFRNILKASAIWVAVVSTAGVISGYMGLESEERSQTKFMQSIESYDGSGFDYLKVTKKGVNGLEDKVICDAEHVEWSGTHICIAAPGEYIIESSCRGVKNMPATLCFDKEWVQANLALGKARIVNNVVWVDSHKGGITPLPDQETIHEADLLDF